MMIKFYKKKHKNQLTMDKIKKSINQIRYNSKIENHFIILQSQHTFWDGGEREKIVSKVISCCVIKANMH